MEWYVYYYDCNAKKICKYNVFDHGSFMKELKVLLRCDVTKQDFSDQLRHVLLRYFWSKCEWETVLKPWVGDDSVEIKIDVYDQVMLNWDEFADYVWNYKEKNLAFASYRTSMKNRTKRTILSLITNMTTLLIFVIIMMLTFKYKFLNLITNMFLGFLAGLQVSYLVETFNKWLEKKLNLSED